MVCAAGVRATAGNLGTAMTVDLRTHGPLGFVSSDPAGADIVPTEDMRLDLAFTNPPAPHTTW